MSGRPWVFILGTGSGLALIGCASAADALFYGVIKSQQYEQMPGGAPQPIGTNAFAFNAFVVCETNYAVTSATVKVPGTSGGVYPLEFVTNGIALRYEERFNSLAALDDAYPSSGNLLNPSKYTVTMRTVHQGTQSPEVSYWLVSQPKTPALANLPAAQAVDATRDFTLQWESLGGTPLDIVQALVTDQTSNLWYVSPAPFTAGALDGNSTSVTIPAGQLPPGRDLLGHLIIARTGLPNTNAYAGAIGLAALLKDTAFPLVTLPALPPALAVLSPDAQPFRMEFLGESNRIYHLLATTNLTAAMADPAAWQYLTTTNSPTGRGTLTDTQSVALPRRWYRLTVGP